MVTVNPAWKVSISGNYPASMRNPYIVVCNHQSLADIPILSRLPWDMKWLGKAELFKIPFLGWMMKMVHDIPIRRGDRRSRAQVMIDIKERLNQNVSVMVMPEGTRSKDGRLWAFNDGAFKLALKMKIPILPLAMDGSFDALPRDGWHFGSAESIRVHVFDPISTEAFEGSGTELRDQVRAMIVDQVAEWRGVPAIEVDALSTSDEEV